MTDAELLSTYIPDLTDEMINSLLSYGQMLKDWNLKINLISRTDTDHIVQHHILHSLSISKFIRFQKGSRILDVGTGGGFPGIPLAIRFPEVEFHLIDARQKKILALQAMITALQLPNVRAEHGRSETLPSTYDFVISRAVASISQLMTWNRRSIAKKQRNVMPNGFIFLKGGEVKSELETAGVARITEITPISEWVDLPWFQEKKVIYIPVY